jgi:hypothetical protein
MTRGEVGGYDVANGPSPARKRSWNSSPCDLPAVLSGTWQLESGVALACVHELLMQVLFWDSPRI